MERLALFVWGLHVVCGLQATHEHTHEGRGEAEPYVAITVASHLGARSKATLSLVGDFEQLDLLTVHRGSVPSLRVQGRIAAAELLRAAMRAEHLSERDLAAALNVDASIAHGMRHSRPPFAVGDLVVLSRRLPDLAALVLGAFTEAP